jgi:hypothetical protein
MENTKELEDSGAAIRWVVLKTGEENPLNLSSFT